MASDRTRKAEAAALADALFSLMPHVVDYVNTCLVRFDLTVTDYWALRSVDGPMPMKDLAHCMDIDPSYATLVADRLEERGLIERQPHPTDRRVKNLVLTDKGRETKKAIPESLGDEPNSFSELTDDERAHLAALLAKLVAANSGEPTTS